MGTLSLGTKLKLTPIPLVTISNEIQRDGAGKPIGATTNITLKGEIFPTGSQLVGSEAYKNLLLASGLDAGIREELNDLFKNSTPINLTLPNSYGSFNNCYIKKYSVEENENKWLTTIPYSIDLVCERIDKNKNSYLVNSTKDSWAIETIEEYWKTNAEGAGSSGPLYRITHSVGAVGKYYPGTVPLQNAKQWVDDEASKITAIIDNSLTLFNHIRKVNINKFEGSYGFDDTWLAANSLSDVATDSSIENFEIEISLDESKNVVANVRGSVQGIEFFDKSNNGIPAYDEPSISSMNFVPGTGRFANALKTYIDVRNQIYSRSSTLAGVTLNPKPLSIVEGFDSAAGMITYSFSYDSRPKTIVPEAISENISVDTNYGQKKLYASIFVLGRKLGPILQEINSNGTYSSTTVNYECVLPSSGMANLKFPIAIYNSIPIADFAPGSYLYVQNSGFSWNMNENRLSITIEYVHV
jgi:hypothetical protein